MQAPKTLLTAFLVLGGLLTITPPAQAQDASDWTVRVVPSNGQAVSGITSDYDGETLGVAFEGNDLNTYFAIEETDGTFTLQNLDVTGTVDLSNRDMVNYGTDSWVICGQDEVLDNIFCWRSTDDGATWTIGTELTPTCAAAGGHISDLEHLGGTAIGLICNVTGGDLYFVISGDAGATWGTGESISDNQGDPTDASTASVLLPGTGVAGIAYSSAGIAVRFPRQTNLDLFEVGSDDLIFWNTPFEGDGSNVRTPIAAPCASEDYIRTLGKYKGNGNYWAAITTPAPAYVCANGVPIPSDPGTFTVSVSTVAPSQWLSCNLEQQCLIAFADLTAGENYVWYDPDGAAPSLVYQNMADTAEFSLTQTDTRGAFFYANNQVGGRLEVATASVFLDEASGTFNSWCSNPGILNFDGDPNADFGYNYVEQATFEDFTAISDVDLGDGYLMTSTSDNASYMGKGWEAPGSAAVKVYFGIEARSDTQDSVFRTHLSFITDTPSATSKGDGKTTGSFSDFIGARFEEDGSNWRISLIYNNGGQDPFMTYGSTVVYAANPNTPRLFSLTVDTRGSGFATIRDETSNQTIINVASLAASGQPFLAVFAGDDPMYSQWFVTTGTSGVFFAETVVDDPTDGNDSDDSTCIFYLDQPVIVTGDPGTTPPSIVPDVTTTPTVAPAGSIGSVFVNITDAGTQIFMGFLMVFGVVWMGIRQNVGFAAIGALFMIGLMLSYGVGLIPLWILILIFVVSAAAVWFLPKPNSGGL